MQGIPDPGMDPSALRSVHQRYYGHYPVSTPLPLVLTAVLSGRSNDAGIIPAGMQPQLPDVAPAGGRYVNDPSLQVDTIRFQPLNLSGMPFILKTSAIKNSSTS